MREAVRETVLTIVTLLARGEFSTVERMVSGRLTSSQMEAALIEYGRRFLEPTSDWDALIDLRQVSNAEVSTFSVRVPFRTAEEGRSDLEAWMTLREVASGIYEASVDDIRVP
jgi:hypothetical protein